MLKKMIKIIILIMVAILLADIYFEVNFIKICFAEYKSHKLKTGEKIKILQISDYHDKSSYNDMLIKRIEQLYPDIVVITGDFVDASTEDLRNVYSFIDKLRKINSNIFFVSGNHEWKNENKEELLEGLEERKIIILNNGNVEITVKNTKLNICGIDDYSGKHSDLREAFNGVNKDNFTILLSHVPNVALDHKGLPADLILCGHTHGGQIRVPFIGPLVAPGQGYLPKYTKGFYKINDNIMYIDSGVGTSVSPIRFMDRSQVSLITIEGK